MAIIFDQVADKYADIMPIEEFKECVACGAFIPDDGIGYLGTETHYTYQSSVWNWGSFALEGATHVHWYNR